MRSAAYTAAASAAICLAWSFAAPGACAQQTPQLSQYLHNPSVINPALTGIDVKGSVFAASRAQWMGVEGAPVTAGANVTLPVGGRRVRGRFASSHSGAGAKLYVDREGAFLRTGVYGAYAYHVRLGRDLFWSTGLFAGLLQVRYDATEAVLVQSERDALVFSSGDVAPDAGLGTFLYNDRYFGGLSVNHVFAAPGRLDAEGLADATLASLARDYTVLAGARFPLPSRGQTLVPSVLVKHLPGAPVQVDVNGKIYFDDAGWLGLSYRHRDALVALAGMRFAEQFTAGLSYDFTLSRLRADSRGSAELVVSYSFPKGDRGFGCPQSQF